MGMSTHSPYSPLTAPSPVHLHSPAVHSPQPCSPQPCSPHTALQSTTYSPTVHIQPYSPHTAPSVISIAGHRFLPRCLLEIDFTV
ncbi:hypothetical protein AVEN_19360-1 [Araneus ventricosus]|uniref:Uncharacterized protein n=1 Tax=Araneus ventricosus TaxID=182803 RepID=A0A4Y2T876_ARAVE|nr:hypothetical protein AVEN_19360-1 [Araneus ventricosus]